MPKSEMAGSRYRIFETRRFLSDLAALGSVGHRRLEARLREFVYPALSQSPHFGPNIKQLKNWNPPTWRFRVGDWRLFFEIDQKQRIVFLTAAEHRKDAYR